MTVRRAIGFVLFAAAFAVFAWSTPPGQYWLDSGELTAAATSLGVAHPTGFPLFCLGGKALALVPLGEQAFRLDLWSALCGAATVWLLYRLGLEWWNSIPGAVLTAVLPAAGLTFFRQSTVAEVYTPSALVLVLAVGLTVRVAQTRRARDGLALALVLGLSLGVHAQLRWLAIVPGALVLIWRARKSPWVRVAPALFVLGAGVLVYMPVRAARTPAANWGDPQTAGALADQLSAARIRRAFQGEMLSRDRAVVTRHARTFGRMVVEELGVLAPLCAVVGLFALTQRRWLAALLVAWIAALDAVYAVWVNPMGLEDLQNGVPLHLAVAIFAGAGVAWMGKRLGRAGPAASAAMAVCVILPAALANLDGKLGSSDGADRLREAVLLEAAPRAAVLASSDDVNAGLAFARAIGERPDVIGLPQQHLWDRALTGQVFARAGAGAPPDSPSDVVRRLVARGPVLWEDGPDLPPGPLQLAPAAPLPRVVAVANTHAQPASDMLAAARDACAGVEGDPVGRRACASLFAGLGTTLWRVGDGPRARAMLQVAVGLAPDDQPALVNLGVVTAALGDPGAAATLEERALVLAPDDYAAAANAGRYRFQVNDLDRAARHFERARRARPQAGAPLAYQALIASRRGQRDDACQLIREAQRLEPQSIDVRGAAGELRCH